MILRDYLLVGVYSVVKNKFLKYLLLTALLSLEMAVPRLVYSHPVNVPLSNLSWVTLDRNQDLRNPDLTFEAVRRSQKNLLVVIDSLLRVQFKGKSQADFFALAKSIEELAVEYIHSQHRECLIRISQVIGRLRPEVLDEKDLKNYLENEKAGVLSLPAQIQKTDMGPASKHSVGETSDLILKPEVRWSTPAAVRGSQLAKDIWSEMSQHDLLHKGSIASAFYNLYFRNQSLLRESKESQTSLNPVASEVLTLGESKVKLGVLEGLGSSVGLKSEYRSSVQVVSSLLEILILDKFEHPEGEFKSRASLFTDFDAFVLFARFMAYLPPNLNEQESTLIAQRVLLFIGVSNAFESLFGQLSYTEIETRLASLTGENLRIDQIKTGFRQVYSALRLLWENEFRYSGDLSRYDEVVNSDLISPQSQILKASTEAKELIDQYLNRTHLKGEPSLEILSDEQLLQSQDSLTSNHHVLAKVLNEIMARSSSPEVSALSGLLAIMSFSDLKVLHPFDLKSLMSMIYRNGKISTKFIETTKAMIEYRVIEPTALLGMNRFLGLSQRVFFGEFPDRLISELARVGDYQGVPYVPFRLKEIEQTDFRSLIVQSNCSRLLNQ